MLDAPVLVVAAAGLGTLNHTALTVEALRRRGLTCAGVVVGAWPAEPDLAARLQPRRTCRRVTGVPLLGRRCPDGRAAALRRSGPQFAAGSLVTTLRPADARSADAQTAATP